MPIVHIAIWDAKSDDDLTILHTLGMSEKYMNNADYLAEFCWHIRGKISEDDKHHCSHFMAKKKGKLIYFLIAPTKTAKPVTGGS